MISSCFVLLALALNRGDVTTISAGTTLIAPGKVNWTLREPTIPLVAPNRAIVTRVRPEGTEGVIEVKLYDGTDRLGWLEDTGLTSVRSQVAASPSVGTSPNPTTAVESFSYVGRSAYNNKPRRRRPQDFSAIDAVIGDMQSYAMANRYVIVNPYDIPSARSAGGSGTNPGGGYYYGPRQPAGTYAGGIGSSHKGGTYTNAATGNRYQKN